jgi:hypothetical protein
MILAIVFIYKNNLSKTVSIYENNSKMKTALINTPNIRQQINELQIRLSQMNGIVNHGNDTLSQSDLLNVITRACFDYNLGLQHFTSPHLYQVQEHSVKLSLISLEGSFKDITGCIFWFEESNALKGKIMSVEYKKVRSIRGEGDKLVATIYLQQISK